MSVSDLASERTAIAELCAKYGVVELSVFGSAARGDAESDIDLLYVRGPNAARRLAFFGLRQDLEATRRMMTTPVAHNDHCRRE